MSNTSPILSMPLIEEAQAKKHITHNEALVVLGPLVQLGVKDNEGTTPPATPEDGARFIVAEPATGAWTGQDGRVAAHFEGGWHFFAPRASWQARSLNGHVLLAFEGTEWRIANAATSFNPVPEAGIGTLADSASRLAVAAAASLFTH